MGHLKQGKRTFGPVKLVGGTASISKVCLLCDAPCEGKVACYNPRTQTVRPGMTIEVATYRLCDHCQEYPDLQERIRAFFAREEARLLGVSELRIVNDDRPAN
jgi:hypothetical protein